jgi:glycosyltransferase involved in cell wall biosynthesis
VPGEAFHKRTSMSEISVIVITYNEQKNIRKCLSSIDWADEIVVVDSGSTDDTKRIASEFTRKVLDIKWEGFGMAKDFARDQATCQWILSLDADEVVTEDLKEEIQRVIASPEAVNGYHIPRRSNFLGRWIEHGGWYPDYVLRLFRKDKARFTHSAVHERVEVDGEKGHLNNALMHHTDPNFDHYLGKLNRYTSLAAEELFKKGKRAKVWDVIFRPLAVFLKMYLAKRGFLDGFLGFILAVSSAFHVFSKYVKLWHLGSLNGGQ